MAKFCERLRHLRNEESWSQQYLAKLLEISKSSINMYERGEREPGLETLEAIADIFNVDMDYLLGKSDIRNKQGWTESFWGTIPQNIVPLQEMQKVPLIGQIACGSPILAEENIADYVDLPNHIRADFALTCKGDSMINAGIRDGDVVYIRKQEQVDNGQIAAVRVGEEEATLKRFYFDGQTVTLVAENSAIPPMVYPGEAAAGIHIIGLAVAYTHAIYGNP